MTQTYVLNALPAGALIGREFAGRPASLDEVRDALRGGAISAVGHAETAAAAAALLGVEVPFNRASVAPAPGDVLYVLALRGPRLAEGQILSREEVEARGMDTLRVEITR